MKSVRRLLTRKYFYNCSASFCITLCTNSSFADTSVSTEKFVWNEATQAIVAQADAQNGKVIAQEKCNSCHGENGISAKEDQDIPNLAGQPAVYLFKQGKDFISDLRENRGMKRRVNKLSDQELADVAAWYASLPPANTTETPPTPPDIVINGFPDRNMPGCAVCHGPAGEGVAPFIPRLAGQKADYMKYTLDDFVTGLRQNLDPKTITDVKGLTSHDIDAVTTYYSDL
ncbi:MAG: c-type cytochrome [Gammaproteobacteria bacterium]|nr:c-type cytochrome [Gammaproteobacteria bacterium]